MSVTVDATKLKKALAAFAGGMRTEAAQEMRIQARNLAVQLAYATQPFGDDESKKQNSEKKVKTEIERVYKPTWVTSAIIKNSVLPAKSQSQNPHQAARAFSMLVNGAMSQKGKRKYAGLVDADMLLKRLNIKPLIYTTVGKFDDGEAHEKARFGKNKRVPKNQFVRQVVTNPSKMEKYIEKKKDRVGVAKSGWAMAAQMISLAGGIAAGTRGIPKWVTRHIKKYDTGGATDRADGEKPFVELRNRVRYVKECISPSTIQRTIDIQVNKMVKRLGYILKAEAKKARLA